MNKSYLPGEPSKIGRDQTGATSSSDDVGWINPRMVAWDWWLTATSPGGGFVAGITAE